MRLGQEIKPPKIQIQSQRADCNGFNGPIDLQHDARLLTDAPDEAPQEYREGQRHKVIGNEGDVIAASRNDPPEKAGNSVEGPRHRIAEESGNAYDHEDFCDFFLLEFISEQVHDNAKYQRDLYFAGCELNALHFVSLLLQFINGIYGNILRVLYRPAWFLRQKTTKLVPYHSFLKNKVAEKIDCIQVQH